MCIFDSCGIRNLFLQSRMWTTNPTVHSWDEVWLFLNTQRCLLCQWRVSLLKHCRSLGCLYTNLRVQECRAWGCFSRHGSCINCSITKQKSPSRISIWIIKLRSWLLKKHSLKLKKKVLKTYLREHILMDYSLWHQYFVLECKRGRSQIYRAKQYDQRYKISIMCIM